MKYATILLLLVGPALAQIETKSVVPISVPRKAALVIGNSTYARLDPIPAASFDADDMASTLRALGFEVTVRKNLGVDALISEIATFSQTQVHAGDLALIYYSGHGGSVGEENYLLPVDYDPPSEVDLVETHAYAMSKVRDKLEATHARVRLLVFDACRGPAIRNKGESNPPPIEGRPEGTLIAFASAHKQDALFDASQRNSLYTAQLLPALKQPGLDLKALLEDVQQRVYQDTNHRQTPYLYGFLSGPLYLAGTPPATEPGFRPPATPAGVAPPARAPDLEAWETIRASSDPLLFEEFLKEYPASPYAGTARLKLASLRSAPGAAPSPAPGKIPSGPATDAQAIPSEEIERTVKLTPSAPAGERSATIVAPGNRNQIFNIYYIDTRDFARGGVLDVEIQISPNSRTDGSFDLFPGNFRRPTNGHPDGSLVGRYDVRRGASTHLEYRFNFGQVFALNLEGNWFSPKGATGSVHFRASVHK